MKPLIVVKPVGRGADFHWEACLAREIVGEGPDGERAIDALMRELKAANLPHTREDYEFQYRSER